MASSFSDFSRHFGSFRAGSPQRLSACGASPDRKGSEPKVVSHLEVLKSKIEVILQQRRQRHRFFDPELFADPAWDILLVLALAELQFRRMSVGRLCDASNVPTTTALRWVKHLADKGHVVRVPDRLDNRRSYIELSDSASEAMRMYLESFDARSLPAADQG